MKRQSVLVIGLLLVATAAFAGLHTRSGWVYIQNSQWSEAVRELKLAIAEDPKDDKAQFGLGVAYASMDSVAAAYKHFTITKELDPKKARDCDNNIQSLYAKHYQAGQKHFAGQNMQGAAHEFELATLASPKQSAGHYNLAVAYSRLAMNDSTYYDKTLKEADTVLATAEASDPNHMRALQLAANTLVYIGKPEEAAARMQKTIDEDPSKYQLVEDMGKDLMAQKPPQWAGAATFLKMAADARSKVSADDANIQQAIGVCEYNLGKTDPAHLDEAVTWYQKALDIGGDNKETVFNMMAVYVMKSDWENAALWGEKSVLLDPNSKESWKILARAYTELGQNEKANDALGHYQTLNGQ
ncbi:MAG TPA: tetratricopeptide repeat protein [Terriglobia bacterium]|nr:tetratricopeptide repeat protein [Terriglobia bacterium]